MTERDGSEESDDALTRDFRVYQRVRGHRYSLDDVVTAWEACRAQPGARASLDLGCGLGSVLLMVAWKLPGARVDGVEAQEVSFALAQRNVARNGVGDRVRLLRADLRDLPALASLEPEYELVTGTPPYAPLGTATPSPDGQRAAARVELRGGVEAYLTTAARKIGPTGTVVVCADARTPERVTETAGAVGLVAFRRLDVVPRAASKGALFSVWSLRRGEALEEPIEHAVFTARDADGARTAESNAVRAFFGLVQAPEPPSP